MPKPLDLTGKVFGRLRVIERAGSNRHGKVTWKCVCECGTSKIVIGSLLSNGTTKSCGCLRKEVTSKRTVTHGMRNTRFYGIWHAMKKRCNVESSINYEHYGGRGITVCERWLDFNNFKEDMYSSYESHVQMHGETQTTLDRIDVNEGYTKDNTRWATRITQNRNTRLRKDNKTGHKGVWDSGNGYLAHIKVEGIQKYLGTFDNLDDAVVARKRAEEIYWTQ